MTCPHLTTGQCSVCQELAAYQKAVAELKTGYMMIHTQAEGWSVSFSMETWGAFLRALPKERK